MDEQHGPTRCDRVVSDGYSDVPFGKITSVVTCLDMIERRPLRPEHGTGAWTLRRVARTDAGWYRELYKRVGADWLWYSRLLMTDDRLQEILASPHVEVYALTVADRDEGLLELDFREPDVCELAFFGLTHALQGSGAGRFLMNRAIDQAWRRQIGRFWVHTCTHDHPDALGFYLRSGFRAYAQRIEVADDPRLKGVLPRSAGAHIPIIEAPSKPDQSAACKPTLTR